MTCVTLQGPRLQFCCGIRAVSLIKGRWGSSRASCSRLGRRLPCSLSLQAQSSAIIREAQPDDLDALVYIEDNSRPGGNWNRRNLECEVLVSGSLVLVAEKEKQAVGLLVAWRVPPDELHVLELAVLPEHRRQGLARQLMRQAIDLDRDRVQTVMLEVRTSNHGAQQLYEGLGFKKVGLRRRYYSNGEDAILMNLSVKVDSIA